MSEYAAGVRMRFVIPSEMISLSAYSGIALSFCQSGSLPNRAQAACRAVSSGQVRADDGPCSAQKPDAFFGNRAKSSCGRPVACLYCNVADRH
jgi:hypothetical protein